MLKTAKSNPTVSFATCARLIGPEVKLTIEQSLPAGLLGPERDWSNHAADAFGYMAAAYDEPPARISSNDWRPLEQRPRGRTVPRRLNQLWRCELGQHPGRTPRPPAGCDRLRRAHYL